MVLPKAILPSDKLHFKTQVELVVDLSQLPVQRIPNSKTAYNACLVGAITHQDGYLVVIDAMKNG